MNAAMSKARCLSLAFVAWFFCHSSYAAFSNPQEKIEFWQENYTPVYPQDSQNAARAHEIFQKVLKSAGQRPGVEPRLHIIKENPRNISLPISIPDGWIILSESVLALCYQNTRLGDVRLAFVLAHELAHQLEDDFWHMRFFNVLASVSDRSNETLAVIKEVRRITQQADQVLSKELRADELAVVYVAIAGFDVNKLVDSAQVFFESWSKALHPGRLAGVTLPKSHPSIKQRAIAIQARIEQVINQIDYFNLGLWFQYAGQTQIANDAFDQFRRYFPSREVHHNLAVTHHALALSYSSDEKDVSINTLPFHLELTVEANTHADEISRNALDSQTLKSFHLDKAIHFYRLAIEQDPQYLPAYINLGAAYLLKEKPYQAVATLKEGLALNQQDSRLLNNLGVAFYYVENPSKAEHYLLQAQLRDQHQESALFNLGNLKAKKGKYSLAEQFWRKYIASNSNARYASYLKSHFDLPVVNTSNNLDQLQTQREWVKGLTVGMYEDEMPSTWKILERKQVALNKIDYQVLRNEQGVTAVLEEDEVVLIFVGQKGLDATEKGIEIGAHRNLVTTLYGSPATYVRSQFGGSLHYPNQGISFQLEQGRVVSWLLY